MLEMIQKKKKPERRQWAERLRVERASLPLQELQRKIMANEAAVRGMHPQCRPLCRLRGYRSGCWQPRPLPQLSLVLQSQVEAVWISCKLIAYSSSLIWLQGDTSSIFIYTNRQNKHPLHILTWGSTQKDATVASRP